MQSPSSRSSSVTSSSSPDFYLSRRSDRLAGIQLDDPQTLEQDPIERHTKLVNLACIRLPNGSTCTIAICATCPQPLWLDYLLHTDSANLRNPVVGYWQSISGDTCFHNIRACNPEVIRFGCEGTLEQYAHKAFKEPVGLEKKRLAISGGGALRFTCRNTSRQPHCCNWEVRADFDAETDLWAVTVNTQHHTMQCKMTSSPKQVKAKNSNKKGGRKPKSRVAATTTLKKRTGAPTSSKSKTGNDSSKKDDIYIAKVLDEFSRWGDLSDWHYKRQNRRKDDIRAIADLIAKARIFESSA